MYKEMKVYEDGYMAYLCRGTAVDTGFIENGHDWKAAVPNEGRLLYTKRQGEELAEAIRSDDTVYIYRYMVQHDGVTESSSWFMTEDDALRSPLAKEYPENLKNSAVWSWVQCLHLNMSCLQPVKFPVVLDLESANDGRLFTQFNFHPERDGAMAKGVICFPDRSMAACAGRAIVTGVKEKGTYAFLLGHMLQYGIPDMTKFLDYAWETQSASDMSVPLYIVNHPILGKLICSDKYVWVETSTSPYCQGMAGQTVPYQKVEWVRPDDFDQYVEKKTSLRELILAASFGDTGVSLHTNFPICKGLMHRYNELWQPSSKLMPEIIEQAIADGLMTAYCLPSYGIHALEFNEAADYRLAAFAREEISEMAAEYSRINAKADQMITSKLRKGKLRMFKAA